VAGLGVFSIFRKEVKVQREVKGDVETPDISFLYIL
jgi:hypothetical protein